MVISETAKRRDITYQYIRIGDKLPEMNVAVLVWLVLVLRLGLLSGSTDISRHLAASVIATPNVRYTS